VTRLQLYSTSLGVCEVPVPRGTALVLALQSGIDGFAGTTLAWAMALGEMLPTLEILYREAAQFKTVQATAV
jgi:hypothetical protein